MGLHPCTGERAGAARRCGWAGEPCQQRQTGGWAGEQPASSGMGSGLAGQQTQALACMRRAAWAAKNESCSSDTCSSSRRAVGRVAWHCAHSNAAASRPASSASPASAASLLSSRRSSRAADTAACEHGAGMGAEGQAWSGGPSMERRAGPGAQGQGVAVSAFQRRSQGRAQGRGMAGWRKGRGGGGGQPGCACWGSGGHLVQPLLPLVIPPSKGAHGC